MSECTQSGDMSPENSSAKTNIDPDYRPDVWPQSSRYVVNGLLGTLLAIAGVLILGTQWSAMGVWSLVFGVLLLVSAVLVVRFSFRLK